MKTLFPVFFASSTLQVLLKWMGVFVLLHFLQPYELLLSVD